MRPLPQLFYSTVLATFTMLAYSADGFAGEIVKASDESLRCSENERHPSKIKRQGRDGVTYSVLVKELRVDGRNEPITKLKYNYGARDRRKLPKDLRDILDRTDVHITGQCEGDAAPTNLWSDDSGGAGNTVLKCKKGEGMVVKQYQPTCDIGSNEHVIVTISEIIDGDDLVAQDEQRKREELENEILNNQAEAYRYLAQMTGARRQLQRAGSDLSGLAKNLVSSVGSPR